jgi:DegV family protein with EDD domain
MSKVALVTDSTAYIPQELLAKYGIRVAPQVLIWNGSTYEDGVNIQPTEFYTRLKTASIMPTSSQVAPASFKRIFEELLAQDCQILAVLISHKLSGTISSAQQIIETMPKAPITIVDSHSTSMAMGFQVLAAAEAAAGGASLAECCAIAEQARERTGILVTVDTLEFLHRGGRIGGATRFLGTALNLKPLLEIRGGRLEPIERVRTRRKALARMSELFAARTAGKQVTRIAAVHANAAEDAQTTFAAIQLQYPNCQEVFTDVSPVIGTHAGPGTIGLAYMTK